jgi:NAD-dependent DNA ligase
MESISVKNVSNLIDRIFEVKQNSFSRFLYACKIYSIDFIEFKSMIIYF